jgi:hypothetical protein
LNTGPTARGTFVPIVVLVFALALPGMAVASDTIYWASREGAIGFAGLDGSGGANLNATGASLDEAAGVAIDSATGRIYWVNRGGSIGFADLDGKGGGTLDTHGASLKFPQGLAIDPIGRRLYWTNPTNNTISFANLDGGGGGDLTISGASVKKPDGIAVDPVARRLYWGNTEAGATSISFANLDGSEGGVVPLAANLVPNPTGIAIDTTSRRIYWTNFGGAIRSANLSGGDLKTVASPLENAIGIALDADRGRIYWGDFLENQIDAGNLDNTGREKVNTGSGNTQAPFFVALLEAPMPAAAPTLSGDGRGSAPLSCSTGAWASDLSGAFLFRAPHTFAYRWLRNGAAVAGATQSTLLADPRGGTYQCEVTAQNHAGSAEQTSGSMQVAPLAFDSGRTRVTLSLASPRIRSSMPLRIRVVNENAFPVTGSLSGRPTAGSRSGRGRKLPKTRLSLSPSSQRVVRLRVPSALRTILDERGKLALSLTANVVDPAGHQRTVKKAIVVRAKS